LYLNNGKGVFSKSKDALPDYFENGSIVRISDVDHDGDMDMFVGGRVVAKQFGKSPKSYLLLNDGKGKFKIANSVLSDSIGMVTDAVFSDFNNDGYDDLIVVGEWMTPQFFENVKGTFKNVTSQMADVNNTGLWQAIIPFDIDGDGDTDYLLGNWGLNSKFKASAEEPLKMYAGDFNQDHRWESLLCFAKNGHYYSINEKDELDKYLPKMMHNKFKSYKDFAGKSFYQIFDQSVLDKGILKTVTNLSSGYLENNNGHFTFKPFNPVLQLAPITCFAKSDFNKDGKDEVLMAGNLLALPPYNGTLDGNVGYILEQGGKVISGIDLGLNFGNKAVKHLKVVTINHKKYVWAAVNGGKMMVYQILN
jgi:hypothetical protein